MYSTNNHTHARARAHLLRITRARASLSAMSSDGKPSQVTPLPKYKLVFLGVRREREARGRNEAIARD